jgi:hypothetical protein
MMTFRVRFSPERDVTIDFLRLLIPLRDEHARLFHACGESIRMTNRAGYVPKGDGVVWTSREVPNAVVLGTFIPYFWLGDYDRGLCWMADNDRGWSVDDEAPAVEFVREARELTARVNLFSRPRVLTAPVEIVFALMAGPPKPEPAGWRLAALPGNPPELPNRTRYRLGWYCNVPTFQGYGKPPDMEKYLEFVTRWKEQNGEGWGVNMSPNDLWGRTEENLYYEAEWYPGYPSKVRNDYVMYNLDRLMEQGYIDGLYSDDVYPVAHDDAVTGIGYVREDGKIQAGYHMFALRDFYKRSAVLFRKHGCRHGMLVHMTDSMIMPAYCFWDGKHDNEWSRGLKPHHDFIDAFPLGEICARSMSRQYGMAASWHTPAPGHGDDLACLLLLHDIVGRVDSMDNRTLPAKLLFGIDAEDVEFLGYWALQPDVDPRKKGVKMSAWVRRETGSALLTVANLGDADWTGALRLPLAIMGLAPDTVIVDAEENHPRLPIDDGRVSLAVPRHDYRLFLLGPAGMFPADEPQPGAALLPEGGLLEPFCDAFERAELGKDWAPAVSPASGGEISVYRNRLCVLGRDYKFAAAQRPLPVENVRVQVRVERPLSPHQNVVGLALVWDNGATATAGLIGAHDAFEYAVASSAGDRRRSRGAAMDTRRPGRMHQLNWVRIDLEPDAIVFYGSPDGRTWNREWRQERTASFRGPPAVVRLGKSPDGAEQPHRPSPSYVYFDDLFVSTP